MMKRTTPKRNQMARELTKGQYRPKIVRNRRRVKSLKETRRELKNILDTVSG